MNPASQTTGDILIAGGGIAGLALAGSMARHGWRVRVIERAEAFAPLGAGIVLAHTTCAILDALGCGEAVRARSRSLASMTVREVTGRAVTPADEGAPLAHTITRAALHEILLQHAVEHGATLHMGRRITSITEGAARVAVTLDDAAALEADLIVGADGIGSGVRQLLAPHIQPAYAGYTCWRFVGPNVTDSARAVEIWGDQHRAGVVPLADGQCYVFACATAPEHTPDPDDPAEAWAALAARMDDLGDEVRALIDAARRADAPLLHHDLHDLRQSAWGQGRVLLIGDAAHATTPNMGYGAGLALEDVAALVAALSTLPSLQAIPAALDEVRRAREQRARAAVDMARRLGQLAHARPALRRAAVWAMSLLPARLTRAQTERFMAPGQRLADRLRATPALPAPS